jgi:hypothetical protein
MLTIEDAQMRAATDPAFRERLLADPAAALAEAGVELPAGLTIAVHDGMPDVEGNADRLDLVVSPLLDLEGALSDDALAGIEGGHLGPPLWVLTRGPSPWDAQ